MRAVFRDTVINYINLQFVQIVLTTKIKYAVIIKKNKLLLSTYKA